jgi:hypothetical protein
MQHQFIDTAPLTGARITADGYMVGEVLCARTGCQDYLASDFGILEGGVVTVYRAPEVVFAKDSLATFAGKPVTIGHPSEAVTAANWKALAVGDIGTDIARDGEFVRVPYKVMDAGAIADIQAGTREVSMGYTTGVQMRDGVAPDGTAYQAVQTGPIRINHLAIVPKARGGSQLRIGDDAAPWGVAPLTPKQKEIGMSDQLKTVVLGDKAVQVAAADAHTIDAFKADAAKALTDAKADHDKAMAVKDASLAAKDAEIATLKAKTMTDADIDKLVADRADLISKAKAIHATVDTAGKSAADIKRAVVTAKIGDEATGKSEAYLDAMFDILATADKADPIKAALADGKNKQPTGDIYAERNKQLSDAWKGGK